MQGGAGQGAGLQRGARPLQTLRGGVASLAACTCMPGDRSGGGRGSRLHACMHARCCNHPAMQQQQQRHSQHPPRMPSAKLSTSMSALSDSTTCAAPTRANNRRHGVSTHQTARGAGGAPPARFKPRRLRHAIRHAGACWLPCCAWPLAWLHVCPLLLAPAAAEGQQPAACVGRPALAAAGGCAAAGSLRGPAGRALTTMDSPFFTLSPGALSQLTILPCSAQAQPPGRQAPRRRRARAALRAGAGPARAGLPARPGVCGAVHGALGGNAASWRPSAPDHLGHGGGEGGHKHLLDRLQALAAGGDGGPRGGGRHAHVRRDSELGHHCGGAGGASARPTKRPGEAVPGAQAGGIERRGAGGRQQPTG